MKTCDLCGQNFSDPGIISPKGDSFLLMCPNCYKLIGTCHTCKNANTCNFESNPSTLPKTIQKEIRQGPIQAVTTIMNPERVRITCEKGCSCFSKKNGCYKQITAICGNFKFIFD